MHSLRSLLRLVAYPLIGLAAATASADIIEYSVTVDNGGAKYKSGDSGTFQLPQFDDEGGTKKLLWVELEVNTNAYAGYTILDNESPLRGGSATVGIGAEMSVTSNTPLAPIQIDLLPDVSNTGPVAVDDPNEPGTPVEVFGYMFNPDFAGPDSIAVYGGSTTQRQSTSLAAGQNDLSGFIGQGWLTWQFDSQTHAWAWTDLLATQDKTDPPAFVFDATVRYGVEPKPAPEPGTLALLAIALPAVGLARRRRRPSANA